MATPPVVAQLEALLRRECPEVEVTIDAPRDPKGEWVLDLRKGNRHTSISWRRISGFGLFTAPHAGIGDRPDELYMRAEEACARACQLLAGAHRGISLMRLKDLRHLRGTSQMELADAMQIDQAAVSRLEARGNMHLNSLVQYIEAMGGKVEIRAKFDQFEARIDPGAVMSDASKVR